MSSERVLRRRRLLGFASVLETAYPTDALAVVDAAAQLCSMLKDADVSLTTSEKMRVLKSVAKAKVRAFMSGPNDDYQTFKTLDAIGSDLIQLL